MLLDIKMQIPKHFCDQEIDIKLKIQNYTRQYFIGKDIRLKVIVFGNKEAIEFSTPGNFSYE